MANAKIKSAEDFVQSIVDSLAAKNAETTARINDRNSTFEKHLAEAEKAVEVIESADAMIANGEMPKVQDVIIARETVATVERLAATNDRMNEKDTKSLSPESPSRLATALADVVRSVLPVPVIAAAGKPRDFQSLNAPADLAPFVVVVGDGEPTADFVGALSGSVSVYYYRTGIHARINVADLEDAARKNRVRVEVRRNEPATGNQGVVVDVLKVNVANVYEGLPLVRKVGNVPNLAHQYAENLVASGNSGQMVHGSGRIRPHLGGGFSSQDVPGMSFTGSAPKWSESISDDGTRTLTVTSALTMNYPITPSDLAAFKSLYIGGIHLSAGELVDIEVADHNGISGNGVNYSFKGTYRSRIA